MPDNKGVTSPGVGRITSVTDVHPSKAVLAAHALGALPDDDGERAAVEAHVGACEECHAQLREFRLAAAALVGDQDPVVIDDAALDRTWEKVQKRLGH
jgi:anti-sigma factor ChrR (cupin superfamily)